MTHGSGLRGVLVHLAAGLLLEHMVTTEPDPLNYSGAVIALAQRRINAQIAAKLHISVRLVGSHLDRIGTRPAAAVAST